MNCMGCGASLRRKTNQSVAYDFGGLPGVTLRGIETRTCTNGHTEIAIPKVEELHHVLATALSEKPGLLAPEEIRFLRKFLGWSQADFAKRMGVAAESASRWESGSVAMAATADRLLRLMVRTVEPVNDYKIFDLFSKLKPRRDPARMKVTRDRNQWKATSA